jgi:hypothetical protein
MMRKGGRDWLEQIADEPLMVQPMIPNIILERSEDGHVRTNVPHLVVHHSPTGYEWGFMGSGPGDLALNICEALLRAKGYKGQKVKCYRETCFEMAWSLHLIFRDKFLLSMPHEGGMIPIEQVQSWITEQMQRTFFQPLAQGG